MPISLLKRIVAPDVYRVKDSTGKLSAVPITSDRLKTWAANAKQMMKEGINIPIPFAHTDDSGKVPFPVFLASKPGDAPLDARTGQPIGWRADLNAGFIQDIFYSPDGSITSFPENVRPLLPPSYKPQGEGLYSILEASGDASDPQSPAWKLQNTVKEVSVCAVDGYEDGKGNRYGEAPMHVAACVHPREQGQPPFIPLASTREAQGTYALAMSDSPFTIVTMAESIGSSQSTAPSGGTSPGTGIQGNPAAAPSPPDLLTQVLVLLRVQDIVLPEDTTDANFLERLVICLGQKQACDQAAESEQAQSPPVGSEQKPPAIAMSDATVLSPPTSSTQSPPSPSQSPPSPNQSQYSTAHLPQSILAMSTQSNPTTTSTTGTVVPATGQSLPAGKKDHAAILLMAQVATHAKASLTARVEKLVATGRVGKAYADSTLLPKIANLHLVMSLDTMDESGNFPKSDVEQLIEGLESAGTPNLTDPLTDGSQGSGNPPAGATLQEYELPAGDDPSDAEVKDILDELAPKDELVGV